MWRFVWGAFCLQLMATPAMARANPHDDLEHLPVRPLAEFSAEDERRFNELVDEVVTHFQDTVASFGGTLSKDVNWESPIVNATANVIGNHWRIIAYGGLFRAAGMTEDDFQLAICQEAGHLLGGFPYYAGSVKATSEGQADYFAAQVCARKIWRDQADKNQRAFEQATDAVKVACSTQWPDDDEAALCARIALSGEHLINALSGSHVATLDTPDTRTASATIFNGYPQAQCRVDTYFRAALCTADWNFFVIPGRGIEPVNGVEQEAAAHLYSCHRSSVPEAARPACWYAQRVD